MSAQVRDLEAVKTRTATLREAANLPRSALPVAAPSPASVRSRRLPRRLVDRVVRLPRRFDRHTARRPPGRARRDRRQRHGVRLDPGAVPHADHHDARRRLHPAVLGRVRFGLRRSRPHLAGRGAPQLVAARTRRTPCTLGNRDRPLRLRLLARQGSRPGSVHAPCRAWSAPAPRSASSTSSSGRTRSSATRPPRSSARPQIPNSAFRGSARPATLASPSRRRSRRVRS